jgi:hypothetical protein
MEHNMYEDMKSASWLVDKARRYQYYAQNLYAAMCNMQWQKMDVMPILKDEYWSVSWRRAGGLVAELRDNGEDYMDYYCSGMGGLATYDVKEGEEFMARQKYVPEGQVTEEIQEDLARLGWQPVPYDDNYV